MARVELIDRYRFLALALAGSAALHAAVMVSVRARLESADDTEDFLKPDNWEGRADIWKLDPKAKTLVGETTEGSSRITVR
ncbi:MAG: hypothetical protein H7Y14_10645, partial [Burkholderiales bacterium]|nr:hypothetical protein [Burkholderiales bacterium]